MRTDIVIEGANRLEYEIRHIVEDAYRIRDTGVEIIWENIGDPIQMGESVEPWIKEIVHGLLDNDKAWAYCHSRGLLESREFLADQVNQRGGAQVNASDILFVNGIADAVDKIYDLIRKDARVIMPSPSYPTHISNESKRGRYDDITFPLDPKNNWRPDLEELRNRIKYNPQVVGIAFVNPDNPTGVVYTREELEEIVKIADEYGLLIICDEIYAHININKPVHLSEVIGDVPGIALRGISKEYPWPGARCGWLEILNARKKPDFARYIKAIVDSKMMEVCSTTLPQMSIPKVISDPRYRPHLRRRAEMFYQRAQEAYAAFKDIPGLIVNPTQGAFYCSPVFDKGVLNNKQTLPIANAATRSLVEEMVKGVNSDKRFVYYLMGATGICVTPLSGFHTQLEGFRITLLRHNDEQRRQTLGRIAESIRTYIASA